MRPWPRMFNAILQRRGRGRRFRSNREEDPRTIVQGNDGPRRDPLDAAMLETRVLYSASPLVEMFAAAADGAPDGPGPERANYGEPDSSITEAAAVFMPPLAESAGPGSPVLELPTSVTIDEDTPSAPILINLHDPDTPVEGLTVTVTSTDQRMIKDANISMHGDGVQRSLVITPEQDKYGGPVKLQVSLSDGQHTTTGFFDVTVQPVNDRPEAVNLRNLRISDGAHRSVVDLHAAFHDVDHADHQLAFSVTNVSNPRLFSEVTVDSDRGTLTLEYASGMSGMSNITIRATDPTGAYVEIGPTFRPLKLYEAISAPTLAQKPDMASLGIEKITLLTQWALFDMVDGRYVYDHVNYGLLERALTEFSPSGVPVVLDIENEEFFGNDPSGRDHLGQVLRFAHQVRPDLEIGMYTLLPQGNWWTPMYQVRMEADLAAGLNTWYTQNADRFEQDYIAWKNRNALYRTDPLSSDPDGKVLADYIENVNPSLYTPYRHFWTKTYESRAVDIDPTTDRLTSTHSWHNGDSVVFSEFKAGLLPQYMQGATRLFVVNSDGTSFQLSTSPNGVAIDFNLPGVTTSNIAAWMPMETDKDVRDWHAYAEYNVEEARKYGNQPVYAWISPSIRGAGVEFLEGSYFREQLEILSTLVDAVVIYEPYKHDRAFHEDQPWWHELSDFVAKQQADDTWFQVRVERSDSALVARDDAYAVQASGTLVVDGSGLLANDSGGGSTSYWIASVEGPQHGQLQWNKNGTFEYRQTDPSAVEDDFRYVLRDAAGRTSEASVHIAIQDRYHAPSPSVNAAAHQAAAEAPPATGSGKWAAPAVNAVQSHSPFAPDPIAPAAVGHVANPVEVTSPAEIARLPLLADTSPWFRLADSWTSERFESVEDVSRLSTMGELDIDASSPHPVHLSPDATDSAHPSTGAPPADLAAASSLPGARTRRDGARDDGLVRATDDDMAWCNDGTAPAPWIGKPSWPLELGIEPDVSRTDVRPVREQFERLIAAAMAQLRNDSSDTPVADDEPPDEDQKQVDHAAQDTSAAPGSSSEK